MLKSVSQESLRNNHIEILRAFAVVYVLVLHLQVIPYYFSGADFLGTFYSLFGLSVGVDLFLVISGYVITASLLRLVNESIVTKRKQVLAFWLRRIYRLLPSAWIWLVVVVFYDLAVFLITGDSSGFLKDLLSVLIAMFNGLNIYAGYCYPGSPVEICAPNVIQGHYWSLSLEEQFYLLFPLLFFFLNRKVFIATIIVAIALQLFWTRPLFTLFFYLKTDALCWGVLLALFANTIQYQRIRAFFCQRAGFSLFLLCALLVLLPWAAGKTWGVFTMESYGVSLIAFIGALIVLLASFEFMPLDVTKPATKLMLYLGSRSYGLYVVHLIVFEIIGEARNWYSPGIAGGTMQYSYDWLLIVVAVALTFYLAELNFRKIESPWREKGRVISRRLLQSTN
jgi:peptidoglycan/LPS O-acetylase OafA/YrhL